MKKVLAIILAICMMAVFVPAFAISAADEVATTPTLEEAIAGKQKLVAFTGSSDTVEGFATIAQGAQVNGGSKDCSFLDGNVYFDRVNAKTMMSALTDEEVLTYVDGKLATMAPNHAGILPYGIGGGYQLSIFNAGFKPGVESTVTLVFGNTGFYTQFKVTPDFTSLGYDSSEAIIFGTKATITVTGADIAAAYKKGDSVPVQLHDDHNTRTFTVESVTGNTVVFQCDDFAATANTLLEINKGTDKGFCVVVDNNYPGGVIPAPDEGETFYAAYQTKPGDISGTDMRFIFSAKISDLETGYADNASIAQNAKLTVTFDNGYALEGEQSKSFTVNFNELTYLYEVDADGAYWVPEDGCALFGLVIRGVPSTAWTSYTVTITNGDDTLYEGSNGKGIHELLTFDGKLYTRVDGEENIHAGNLEDEDAGDRPGNNEGAWRFFDKTNTKMGIPNEVNTGTIQVTWNYGNAKTITAYSIFTGNDSDDWHASANRNPLSWVLYGANSATAEGSEWTVIDEVTDPKFYNDNYYQGMSSLYYGVDNPGAYQYYKIVFVTNPGVYFQISEMMCYETFTGIEGYDIISGAKDYTSDPLIDDGNDRLENVFDGNWASKGGYYVANIGSITFDWSYDAPVSADGYVIVTGNDSFAFVRNPSSWTLYGSVNGEDYVVLDSASYAFNANYDVLTGTVSSNAGAYQYYRLTFNVDNHAFQIAEIALFEVK